MNLVFKKIPSQIHLNSSFIKLPNESNLLRWKLLYTLRDLIPLIFPPCSLRNSLHFFRSMTSSPKISHITSWNLSLTSIIYVNSKCILSLLNFWIQLKLNFILFNIMESSLILILYSISIQLNSKCIYLAMIFSFYISKFY